MQQRVDRIPFESIVGWDASGNGNLGQMLQEPTLMGAYEGAGITVLARGIRIPAASTDFWGASATGGFPAGYQYLTTSNADCTTSTTQTNGRDYGTSNFLCNPSRIDGIGVINSSQGGGAIFVHGWNHNLEIANTRERANHGTFSGGITVGNGEFPDPFTVRGDNPPPPGLPVTLLENLATGLQVGYGFNRGVKVHHNMVTGNASLGDALYSGTPSAAGGISFCSGADGYVLDHNWVCGNLSSGDGGGVAHSGFINNGTMRNNWVLFNQSQNPTIPTNGGGIAVAAAAPDRTLASGLECGDNAQDLDCPPGLAEGTGRNLLIDGNLIQGNSAESGSGGGLRLQMVNGEDVPAFPQTPAVTLPIFGTVTVWNSVTVQNNIIANNVAGWDGGGVSMQDSLLVRLINNTVISNDTTGSAGVLFNTLGAPLAAVPPPGCNPQPDPSLPQDPSCNNPVITSTNQPAGLVTQQHTPNLVAALQGVTITCPALYGYYNTVGGPVTNSCNDVSLPLLANNLFWQNRPFHVEVTAPAAPPLNQQSVATLVPSLNQTSTGFCAAAGTANGAPGSGGPVNYWDLGVRGDTGPTNHASTFRLLPRNSFLTGGDYNTTTDGNVIGTNPLVLAQYCNGSRLPPEGGGNAGGYKAPPGRSETTGLYPVFSLNQTVVAATVDEGNNWIDLVFGPLSLSNPASYTTPGVTLPPLGNYGLQPTSPNTARNGGLDTLGNPNLIPDHDFLGNPRPRNTANHASIGGVEAP